MSNKIDRTAVNQIVDRAQVARLAQLDTQGQVQAIPFIFVRVDDYLFSPVDGKPKRHSNLSRLVWIKEHPAVTVLIDEYATDWSTLWWLRIYGQALQVGNSDPRWQVVVRSLLKKYPQYQQIEMFKGEPTALCVHIDSWRYWAASPEC